ISGNDCSKQGHSAVETRERPRRARVPNRNLSRTSNISSPHVQNARYSPLLCHFTRLVLSEPAIKAQKRCNLVAKPSLNVEKWENPAASAKIRILRTREFAKLRLRQP